MKLGPVTKLEKRNKSTSKNVTIASCQKFVTTLSFFRFMANLEQSGSRIPETQSVKFIFSLKVTFYPTKTENRTKNYVTQLSQY